MRRREAQAARALRVAVLGTITKVPAPVPGGASPLVADFINPEVRCLAGPASPGALPGAAWSPVITGRLPSGGSQMWVLSCSWSRSR